MYSTDEGVAVLIGPAMFYFDETNFCFFEVLSEHVRILELAIFSFPSPPYRVTGNIGVSMGLLARLGLNVMCTIDAVGTTPASSGEETVASEHVEVPKAAKVNVLRPPDSDEAGVPAVSMPPLKITSDSDAPPAAADVKEAVIPGEPSAKSPGGEASSGDDDESLAAMVDTIVSAVSAAMTNAADTNDVLAPGSTEAMVEQTAVKTGAVGVPTCVAGGEQAARVVKAPVLSDDVADMPALINMRASLGSVESEPADEEPLPVLKMEEPAETTAVMVKERVAAASIKVRSLAIKAKRVKRLFLLRLLRYRTR